MSTPRTDELYKSVCFFTDEEQAVDALAELRDLSRELERENAELRVALTLGQKNCNEEYDRLRKERDANKTALAATRSQLISLREISAQMAKEMRETDHEFASLKDYDAAMKEGKL